MQTLCCGRERKDTISLSKYRLKTERGREFRRFGEDIRILELGGMMVEILKLDSFLCSILPTCTKVKGDVVMHRMQVEIGRKLDRSNEK